MSNVDFVIWLSLGTAAVALVIVVYLFAWVWGEMGKSKDDG